MAAEATTSGDIDAYCTKCKLNLEHVIVAMVGEAVVKVKCKTCGSIHRFRGMPSARPKLPGKAGTGPKIPKRPEALWEKSVGAAPGPELPYDMESSYRAGDLIVHRVFGKGVVQKTLFRKCSVLFRDTERLLATSNT